MLIFFFLNLKLVLLSTQTNKGKSTENSHLKIPHPQSKFWPHTTFSNSIRKTFFPQPPPLLHSPPSWCQKKEKKRKKRSLLLAFCIITKIYIPYLKRNIKGKGWISNHETIKEPVVPNSSACVVLCGGVSSYQELGTNRDKVMPFLYVKRTQVFLWCHWCFCVRTPYLLLRSNLAFIRYWLWHSKLHHSLKNTAILLFPTKTPPQKAHHGPCMVTVIIN